MAIGSQVFTATKDSPDARKPRIRLDEFLLTLFVVVVAALLGVAGGIWLAERDQPAGRRETVSPQASVRLSSQPPSVASETRRVDLPTPQIPKAAGEKSDNRIISLGFPSVRTISHSYRPDYTEIAMELRAAAVLHAARLHDPERVYFDLADSGKAQKPKGRLKSRREVPVRDDRVAGVRVVRWESGSVRVVVDLKRPCEFSYQLNPGRPSCLILRLWTHPPGTLADQKPPRHGITGISAALAADRH